MDFRLKQRKNRFLRKAIDFININMKKFDRLQIKQLSLSIVWGKQSQPPNSSSLPIINVRTINISFLRFFLKM